MVEPVLNALTQWAAYAEEQLRLLDAKQPDDLIASRIALTRFAVSRATLKRCVANGALKSYRKLSAPKNAEHIFSEAELDARFERLKQ